MTIPTEYDEHIAVATYLDTRRLLWCHVPNGSMATVAYRRKLKKLGVKPGVPDILVFQPFVVNGNRYVGLAIEMKRRKGGKTSKDQKQWLADLEAAGWWILIARGADQAIAEVEAAYPRRKMRRAA